MEGYKYVLAFTDHATKELWEYGLVNRSGDEVLKCIKDLVENKLPTYGPGHRWQHYHADGGKELLDAKVKTYLREQYGSKFTWSRVECFLGEEISNIGGAHPRYVITLRIAKRLLVQSV